MKTSSFPETLAIELQQRDSIWIRSEERKKEKREREKKEDGQISRFHSPIENQPLSFVARCNLLKMIHADFHNPATLLP